MDHKENGLRFIYFFTAHLDMFNLFHRAHGVIHGASKNDLQRGGLFQEDISLNKITQNGMSQTSIQCREESVGVGQHTVLVLWKWVRFSHSQSSINVF